LFQLTSDNEELKILSKKLKMGIEKLKMGIV